MFTAFYHFIRRKILLIFAQQYLRDNQQSNWHLYGGTSPQFFKRLVLLTTEKCSRLLQTKDMRRYWSDKLADGFGLAMPGESLQEFSQELWKISSFLDDDQQINGKMLISTSQEVSLGTYISQHQGFFTSPSQVIEDFVQNSKRFEQSLFFYLERNPENMQYTLRILSGYIQSIHHILDDLIDVQCDFLSQYHIR